MRQSIRLIVTAIGVALLLHSQPAVASCAATSQTERIQKADSVVRARAGSRSLTGHISFTALTYLKGKNLGPTFSLRSPYLSATSVDVQWQSGQEYVIFLRSNFGQLRTNVCDGTTTWAERSVEIQALEPGQIPVSNFMSTVHQLFVFLMSVGLGFALLTRHHMRHAAARRR